MLSSLQIEMLQSTNLLHRLRCGDSVGDCASDGSGCRSCCTEDCQIVDSTAVFS